MAHRNTHSAYARLSERLNRFPQGAPPSELLFAILKLLFSEKEAGLVARLPIRPFTAAEAACAWKMNAAAAEAILARLAERAILVDIPENGTTYYCLPPPMAGFFEFSLMRVRADVDQKALSELYYQYINVEEDFIKALFVDGETPLGRIFVQEAALSQADALQVLDYERASAVIRGASHIAISLCYCRHKMAHVGRDCSAPKEICMTFNTTAAALVRHGHARRAGAAECIDLLAQAQARNLVQFGENVRQRVNFICNCCGCCCEAMLAIKRFGLLRPIHSNYIAHIEAAGCTGCGQCTEACPVQAIGAVAGDSGGPAAVDPNLCLGCGVCVRNCPSGAIRLEPRPERVLTPLNTAHRTVVMAVERGTLQHLIFDNQVLHSHRALAAVIGVILRLPPVKRSLASSLLKSRYLSAVIDRLSA
ncbi:MAG: 4Fe-4S dicluster domain-containing protein [Desulfobacterales bacterium]|jgi:ferredoxin|nr:4Fe-4S dicluster domain-containing protein [Desulfobacterales bacterium]